MAVGRITGQMLSSTLNRVTSDLTFRSTGQANLLQLDTSNNRVGIATASPTVPFEVTGAIKGSTTITANTLVAATGSITDSTGAISFGNENLTTTGQINTSGVRLLENEITTIRSNDDLVLSANGSGGVQIEGSLTVSSDLTVNGSVTTVNSSTLTVDDKNIELAHSPSGASASDTLADGGGIILKGSTDHSILWANSTDDWDFTDHIDVASGKVYKVAGTEVLSGTTVTTANAVHNIISSSDSSSVVFNDGIQVDGALDVGSNFTISNTTAITAILDEDNFSSNSATALATQQSIKAFVESQVSSGATITIIDDSSSAISVAIADDDIKIAGGANIGTSISGTTLSVALDAALTGLTSVQVDSINIQDNSITTDSNADLELTPGGTGIVKLNVIGSNDSSVINVRDGLDIDGTFSLKNGTTVDTILDEDGFGTNSATALATQQSIKAYVDAQITAEDLDIAADDSTAIAIDLDSEVLQFSGGANITTKATGNTLTASLDAALTGLTSVTSTAIVTNTISSSDSSAVILNDALNVDGALDVGGGLTISNGAVSITAILDEDDMSSNSATALATQQSIKAYVDSEITSGATLTVIDDSSSAVSVIIANDDLKIAGGNNITTTASGDTLSVALDAALSGLTSVQVDSINIQDNSITTDSNADLEITPGGSGNTNFSKSDNQLILPQGNTAARNGNIEGSFRYNTETDKFEGYSASGWGAIGGGSLTAVDDSSSTITVELADNSVKFAGGNNITTTVSGTTVTTALDAALTGLTSVQIDSINIQDNEITTDSNADLELSPAGTGIVKLDVIGSNNSSVINVRDGLDIDGNLSLNNGTTVNLILDEDDMSSNSATALATQQSIKAFVESQTQSAGTLTVIDDASSAVSVVIADDDLKIGGGANITTSASGDTLSVALDAALTGLTSVQIDSLNLSDNNITTDSNADLTLAPGGTGKINLTAGSDVQVPANIGVLFGTGGEKIESDGTDLTATITGNFVFSGTTAIDVPVGTTGQRPTANTGLIRFNTTLGVYEGSTDGSTYSTFLTAPSGEAADINKDVFTTSDASTTEFTLSFTPAEAQNVLVFVDNIFQESTNNYTVSGNTLTMTAALHDGARLVALHGFDGSGGVSGATWIGGSNTDIDSAIENVDTFTTSTYRAAEYTYVATNAEGDGDSTSGHETGKILIVHDGTTAQMSQYGITHTGTAPVLTFSVDINGGSVRLRAASIAANTGVRFARLGLAPL